MEVERAEQSSTSRASVRSSSRVRARIGFQIGRRGVPRARAGVSGQCRQECRRRRSARRTRSTQTYQHDLTLAAAARRHDHLLGRSGWTFRRVLGSDPRHRPPAALSAPVQAHEFRTIQQPGRACCAGAVVARLRTAKARANTCRATSSASAEAARRCASACTAASWHSRTARRTPAGWLASGGTRRRWAACEGCPHSGARFRLVYGPRQ